MALPESKVPETLVPNRDGSRSPTSTEVAAPREAFLVNHGSFNPPHFGHIVMMERARNRLEREGFHVAFGVLGLASEHHVRQKGAECLPDDTRGELCSLICEENARLQKT